MLLIGPAKFFCDVLQPVFNWNVHLSFIVLQELFKNVKEICYFSVRYVVNIFQSVCQPAFRFLGALKKKNHSKV